MRSAALRRVQCALFRTRGSTPNTCLIRAASTSARDAVERRAAQAKAELALLAHSFERYDGAGKGGLNAKELQAALEDLELPAGEADVAELFRKLDLNKDGTIQLTEWLDAMPRGTRLQILEKGAVGAEGGYVKFTMPEVIDRIILFAQIIHEASILTKWVRAISLR